LNSLVIRTQAPIENTLNYPLLFLRSRIHVTQNPIKKRNNQPKNQLRKNRPTTSNRANRCPVSMPFVNVAQTPQKSPVFKPFPIVLPKTPAFKPFLARLPCYPSSQLLQKSDFKLLAAFKTPEFKPFLPLAILSP
jgi:hypothetical protein